MPLWGYMEKKKKVATCENEEKYFTLVLYKIYFYSDG